MRTATGEPEHTKSAQASGEIIRAANTLPKVFSNREDEIAFVESAQVYGTNYAKNVAAELLIKDGFYLFVSLEGLGADRNLACILTAPSIPSVSRQFGDREDGVVGDSLLLISGSGPLDTQYVFASIAAMRLQFVSRPETLIGGDTVFVQLSFKFSDAKQ